MLWFCRAGQNCCFYSQFVQESKIYIPWLGYDCDLNNLQDIQEFRNLVSTEKGTSNRTSISNWSGQLIAFVRQMQLGDYVLVPSSTELTYSLVVITGEYHYDKNATLHHSREIRIIKENIAKDIFPQDIQYSLRAYRTIFKPRSEKEIMEIISTL